MSDQIEIESRQQVPIPVGFKELADGNRHSVALEARIALENHLRFHLKKVAGNSHDRRKRKRAAR